MVKIEMPLQRWQKINELHKTYIQEIILPMLEEQLIQNDDSAKFFKFLFGDTIEIRQIEIGKTCLSDKLKDIINNFHVAFQAHYGFSFIDAKTDNQLKIVTNVRKSLDAVFNYIGFNAGRQLKSKEVWNRHKFITSVGVSVCPYCNRQYITSYENEDDIERTTADADHYYPKSNYPILQLNICNMVPSCNVCNSKTKSTSNKHHLYPYEDSSDSLMFLIPLDTVADNVDSNVSKIIVDTKQNPKAQASNEVFKLDKIYQAHVDVATEVKRNIIDYVNLVDGKHTDGYCKDYYKKIMGIELSWDEKMHSAWFGFMGKDISKEPLMKLRHDIFNQMMQKQRIEAAER